MTTDVMKPRISLGRRIYIGRSWTRRDKIFLNGVLIGRIKLSEHDRAGTTVCTSTGRQKAGREIAWCVEQAVTSENSGAFYVPMKQASSQLHALM